LFQLITEEDGGLHRRHASPSVQERNVPFTPQSSASLNLPGYGTSAIVAMDKSVPLASRPSVSSGMLSSQSKSLVYFGFYVHFFMVEACYLDELFCELESHFFV